MTPHPRVWLIGVCLLLTSVFWVAPVLMQGDVDSLKTSVVETYAEIVFAGYEDSYLLALDLQEAVSAFVAEPTEETLEAARAAWLAAREPYGQTEAFRFYGGPIDDADGPEGLINAWPLDEAYIDYVEGDADAGIINDVENYPDIDAALLESLNESGPEQNISVGFHAIEFLLWGQDLSADGAGERPYTDYSTAPNAERRAQYLLLTTQLLVEHLEYLVDAWNPEADDNYRAEFLALEPDEALTHILTGIGVLGQAELGGERLFTAYDNQDQEDEHSCFSDNTHRDIINNVVGIRNVYLGQYKRVDGTLISGTGLADLMEAIDAEANAATLQLLELAGEQVNTLHVPFDQAIVLPEEREGVLNAVLTLFDLGDQLAEDARLLQLTINTALPQ